jgi:hypothetical protein
MAVITKDRAIILQIMFKLKIAFQKGIQMKSPVDHLLKYQIPLKMFLQKFKVLILNLEGFQVRVH